LPETPTQLKPKEKSMNNRTISRLVLICVTLALGGCFATAAKLLPNGNHAIATTVGDSWDRSTTIVGEYRCPLDEKGDPKIGQCKLADNAAPPDRVHGQTVAGQVAVGVMGGTGAAVVNGDTARSVAEKGKCGPGANCGTVFNNQVQSLAEALNDNKVKIGVTSGSGVAPACEATKTCPK
jgi:hypothetical protein